MKSVEYKSGYSEAVHNIQQLINQQIQNAHTAHDQALISPQVRDQYIKALIDVLEQVKNMSSSGK